MSMTGVGNLSLEDKIRREIDPATSTETLKGRLFWKLITAAFFVCLAGLAVLATVKLFDYFQNRKSIDSAPVQAQTTPGPAAGQEEGSPGPEAAGTARPEAPAAGTALPAAPEATGAETPQIPALKNFSSYKAGDIYQDEGGVWRNKPQAAAGSWPPGFYQNDDGVWQNEDGQGSALAGLEGLAGLTGLPPVAFDLVGGALGVDPAALKQLGELTQGLNLQGLNLQGLDLQGLASGAAGASLPFWPGLEAGPKSPAEGAGPGLNSGR